MTGRKRLKRTTTSEDLKRKIKNNYSNGKRKMRFVLQHTSTQFASPRLCKKPPSVSNALTCSTDVSKVTSVTNSPFKEKVTALLKPFGEANQFINQNILKEVQQTSGDASDSRFRQNFSNLYVGQSCIVLKDYCMLHSLDMLGYGHFPESTKRCPCHHLF